MFELAARGVPTRRDAALARQVAARGGLRHDDSRRRRPGPRRRRPLCYKAETRILLTKDRHLAATAKGVARVVLVAAGGIDEGAVVLRAALDLDWQHAPFTRCILDNRPLEPAPADLAARVPERLRSAAGPVQRCAECGRLDWPGGHVRRMQLRLAPSSPRPEEERKGRMQPGAVTGPLMG